MKTIFRTETEMKDSTIKWIGNIPESWIIRPVKSLYTLTTGFTPNSKDDSLYDENGETWVTIRDLKGNIICDSKQKISKKIADIHRAEMIKQGSLMYSFKLSVGIVAFAGKDLFTNEAIASFLPKNEYGNLHYLKYASSLIIGNANTNIYGAFIMNQQLILNAPLPLPLPDEQQAIADYLDQTCSKIDEIIAEAKASIDEYKELRIAVVNDAVTHGIDNNAVKDSNVDWIGRIPDNWKIIITKRLFKIKKDIARKEGYTVLSITQKGIVPKVFGGKGQFAADYSNYQLVNKGDFAMNHMDLLTGWLDISEYDGVTSPDYRVFVPTGHEDIYTPYYKYVMQNCYSCKIYYGLGHGVAGVGRWRLPADMFLNFKLPMPPKEEQKKIADFLDKRTAEIDSLITEKEFLINDLEAYKKSLIYEVVTGKRRVV